MKIKLLAPKELACRREAALREMGDPLLAKQSKRYFKSDEKVNFYGIRSAALRNLSREVFKEVEKAWTLEEVMQFCEILLHSPYHEAKGLGILVLTRYKKKLSSDFTAKLYDWLYGNLLNSWALVDVTCPELMGELLAKNPDLIETIKSWVDSDNRWVRRASLVSFLKLAKKKEFHEIIYRQSVRHFADSDDLIQKANGWLLREVGKSDSSRLECFLLQHGSAIPRTTLRYAIERFQETKRKSILEKTRVVPSRSERNACV